MRTVVGVNGILTHGDQNIDLILADMQERGVPTVDVRLPKRSWISARWGGKKDGRTVAELSSDGDILVCHSFGAIRSFHAHKLREYSAIVCIAPAARKSLPWRNPSRVWCYFSPSDWAVRIGSWLPGHPFGRAGIEGFAQPEVHNRERKSDHDDYFEGMLRKEIADQVWHLANQ